MQLQIAIGHLIFEFSYDKPKRGLVSCVMDFAPSGELILVSVFQLRAIDCMHYADVKAIS